MIKEKFYLGDEVRTPNGNGVVFALPEREWEDYCIYQFKTRTIVEEAAENLTKKSTNHLEIKGRYFYLALPKTNPKFLLVTKNQEKLREHLGLKKCLVAHHAHREYQEWHTNDHTTKTLEQMLNYLIDLEDKTGKLDEYEDLLKELGF